MDEPCAFRIVFLSIFGAFIVAMFIALGFYLTSDPWNNTAIETQCSIVNTSIVPDVCTYRCNCVLDGKIEVCQTCFQGCFDVTLFLMYDSNYTTIVTIGTTLQFSAAVVTLGNYPVNSTIECYYNENNPSDVRLQLEDKSAGAAAALFIMAAMAGCCLTFWGLVEIGLCAGCISFS